MHSTISARPRINRDARDFALSLVMEPSIR